MFTYLDSPLADELLATLEELKRLDLLPVSHVQFMARRGLDGQNLALLRIVGQSAEQWTAEGWKPAGIDWTGVGGAADYDDIKVGEASVILIEFGADSINPFLGLRTADGPQA